MMLIWKSVLWCCWGLIGGDGYAAEDHKQAFNPYLYFYQAQKNMQETYSSPPSYDAPSTTLPYSYYPSPSAPYIEETGSSYSLEEQKISSHEEVTDGTSRAIEAEEPKLPTSSLVQEDFQDPLSTPSSSSNRDLQLQLLVPKTKEVDKEKTEMEIVDEIRLLKKQNEILTEILKVTRSNEGKLDALLEASGLHYEVSEKNQEQTLLSLESLQNNFSYIKKTIESDRKSTLFLVYNGIQGGLQLSRAGFAAAATVKALGVLPSFIIPIWGVYFAGAIVGTAIYLFKL